MIFIRSGMVTDVTQGLLFIRFWFDNNNPSSVSSSQKVAPQLLSLVNEELLTNASAVKKHPEKA